MQTEQHHEEFAVPAARRSSSRCGTAAWVCTGTHAAASQLRVRFIDKVTPRAISRGCRLGCHGVGIGTCIIADARLYMLNPGNNVACPIRVFVECAAEPQVRVNAGVHVIAPTQFLPDDDPTHTFDRIDTESATPIAFVSYGPRHTLGALMVPSNYDISTPQLDLTFSVKPWMARAADGTDVPIHDVFDIASDGTGGFIAATNRGRVYTWSLTHTSAAKLSNGPGSPLRPRPVQGLPGRCGSVAAGASAFAAIAGRLLYTWGSPTTPASALGREVTSAEPANALALAGPYVSDDGLATPAQGGANVMQVALGTAGGVAIPHPWTYQYISHPQEERFARGVWAWGDAVQTLPTPADPVLAVAPRKLRSHTGRIASVVMAVRDVYSVVTLDSTLVDSWSVTSAARGSTITAQGTVRDVQLVGDVGELIVFT